MQADPYRVWLSEIMLQQTTVQAVKPYYERFLALFPDVVALAQAPREAVMQAWAGLGYYSRARNLHACAQEVVARHDGVFPADEAALRALPGIGAYTAAAIAAIAFDIRAAAVDWQCRAGGEPADGSGAAAPGGKAADPCHGRGHSAGHAFRGFRPGDDGSGGDHLHAAAPPPAPCARG